MEKVNCGHLLMLSRLAAWLWVKPKNIDITGRDEISEHRYNCLTMCSTCPGSWMPSLITTGQCQTHLPCKIRDIHRLISVCSEGHWIELCHTVYLWNAVWFDIHISHCMLIIMQRGLARNVLAYYKNHTFMCLTPCCCISLSNIRTSVIMRCCQH